MTASKLFTCFQVFLSDLRTEADLNQVNRIWFKSFSLTSGLRSDLNQVLFICFHLSLWPQDWGWLEPSSVYLLSSFSLTSGLRLTWTKFCLFAFIFLSDLRTETDLNQVLFICFHLSLWPQDWDWLEPSSIYLLSSFSLTSGLRLTWTKFCLFAFIFLSDLRTEADLNQVLFICFHLSLWPQDWGWLEPSSVYLLSSFSLTSGLRLTWTKFCLFAGSSFSLTSGLRLTWTKFCLFAFIFLSDLRTEADLNQVLFICFHLSLWPQDWDWLEPSSVYLLSSFSLTSGLRLTWTKFCLFAFIFLSDLRTETDLNQVLFTCFHLSLWPQDWDWLEPSSVYLLSSFSLTSGLRLTWTKFCLLAFIFLSDLRTETDLNQVLFICFHLSLWPQDWDWLEPSSVYLLSSFSLTSGLRLTWTKFCLFAVIFLSDLRTEADLNQVLFICFHLSLWPQDWGWLEPSSVYLLSSFSLTSGLRLTWTKFCLFAFIFLSDLRTEADLNQVLFICCHLSLWPQDWGWLEPSSVYLLSSFSLTSGLRLTWTKFCLFAGSSFSLTSGLRLTWTKFCLLAFIFLSDLRTEADLNQVLFICCHLSLWPQDWGWLEPSSVYLLSSFSLTSGLRLTWTKFCLFAFIFLSDLRTEADLNQVLFICFHLSLWPQDWADLNQVLFICFHLSLWPQDWGWLEPSSVYLLSSFSLTSGLRLTWTKFCLFAVIFLSDLRTETDLNQVLFTCFQVSLSPSERKICCLFELSSFSLTSGLRLTWTKFCLFAVIFLSDLRTETDLNQVLFICFHLSLWPQDWDWLEPSSVYLLSSFSLTSGLRLTWTKFCLFAFIFLSDLRTETDLNQVLFICFHLSLWPQDWGWLEPSSVYLLSSFSLTSGLRLTWTKFCLFAVIFLSDLRTEADLNQVLFICFHLSLWPQDWGWLEPSSVYLLSSFSLTSGLRLTWTKFCLFAVIFLSDLRTEADLNQVLFICFHLSLWPQDWGWLEPSSVYLLSSFSLTSGLRLTWTKFCLFAVIFLSDLRTEADLNQVLFICFHLSLWPQDWGWLEPSSVYLLSSFSLTSGLRLTWTKFCLFAFIFLSDLRTEADLNQVLFICCHLSLWRQDWDWLEPSSIYLLSSFSLTSGLRLTWTKFCLFAFIFLSDLRTETDLNQVLFISCHLSLWPQDWGWLEPSSVYLLSSFSLTSGLRLTWTKFCLFAVIFLSDLRTEADLNQVLFICCHLSLWPQDWGWLEPSSVYLLSSFSLTSGLRLTWTKFCLFAFIFLSDLRTEADLNQVLFICFHLSLWPQDWDWLEPSSVYLLSSFSLTSGLRLTWTKFCLFAFIFLSDLRTEADLNQVLFICFHLSLWPQDWDWLEPSSVYLLSSFSLTSGLRLTWTKFCLFAFIFLSDLRTEADLNQVLFICKSSFSLTSGLRLTWTKFCLFAFIFLSDLRTEADLNQVLFICFHLSLWPQDWGWLEPSSVYLLSSFSLTSGLRLTWTKFCLFAFIFLSDLRTEADLNQVLFICFHLSLWPQDWGWLEPSSVYLLSSFSLTSGLRLTWTKFCLFAVIFLSDLRTETDLNQVLFICFHLSLWPQDWDWLEPSSIYLLSSLYLWPQDWGWLEPSSVYLLSSFSLTSGLRLTWTKFCLFAVSFQSLRSETESWLEISSVYLNFQVSLSDLRTETDLNQVLFICCHLSLWPQDWGWLEPSSVYLLSSFSLTSGLRLTWTKFCLFASHL